MINLKTNTRNLQNSRILAIVKSPHICVGFFFNFAVMNVILFDNNRENYYPLSFTRPIAEFRIRILTIKEKWEKYYKSVSVKTEDYLAIKFPVKQTNDNLWVSAKVLPTKILITELESLRVGEILEKKGSIIAFRSAVLS